MASPERENRVFGVPLDGATRRRWLELSAKTHLAALGPRPSESNAELHAEARSDPASPVAPAYLLWAAENLVREDRHREAVYAFDRVLEISGTAATFVPGLDFGRAALHHKAQAAARSGDVDVALRTYAELAKGSGANAQPLFEAGGVAEAAGRVDEAASIYRRAAGQAARGGSAADLARRALLRLEDSSGTFTPSVNQLVDVLSRALDDRDASEIRRIVSRTHFAVGLAGGHFAFEREHILDELCTELGRSRNIVSRRTLLGSGDKRYLFASGWEGRWFRGDVGFALTRSPRGWQVTGALVTAATDPWVDHWKPAETQKNQPLPFALRAPWPEGAYFMAGGLPLFIIQTAAVLAAGIFAPAVAEGFSASQCGYGPRGFYYNEGPTHQDEDAFAIDFTRYRRFVPFDNIAGDTLAVAPADGVVVGACGGASSGDPNTPNVVEILHPDPATGVGRFLSQYLHLAGPGLISVSPGMAVLTGQRLGPMDDTGNSALDHLHFSIHDQNVPFPGAGPGCSGLTPGASVRPTPLDGVRLGDRDSGTCIRSSNREPSATPVVGQITTLNGPCLATAGSSGLTLSLAAGLWKPANPLAIAGTQDSFVGGRDYVIFIDIASGLRQVTYAAAKISLASISNAGNAVNAAWRIQNYDTQLNIPGPGTVRVVVTVQVHDNDGYIEALSFGMQALGRP